MEITDFIVILKGRVKDKQDELIHVMLYVVRTLDDLPRNLGANL